MTGVLASTRFFNVRGSPASLISTPADGHCKSADILDLALTNRRGGVFNTEVTMRPLFACHFGMSASVQKCTLREARSPGNHENT
jgi:hypothetical protein